MKKLSNKKGFTLIEMLIVVAIIAVLAAVTLPTFSGATDKANSAADNAQKHNDAVVNFINNELGDTDISADPDAMTP